MAKLPDYLSQTTPASQPLNTASLGSGIAMAIVLVVISVGSALQGIFTDVQSGLVTGA